MNAPEPTPASPDAASPPTDGVSPGLEEILAAFESDTLKPRRVSPLYRLGLLAVAIAMILLPLVYLGLVGLCGWSVLYHATEHTDILSRGGAGAIFAYLAPLTVGLIAILFLVKPLFARRPEPTDALILGEDEAPILRAFVARICRLAGSPEPREIEINCEVNAAASFRRGWRSLAGQDLKLIVGLPLAAGLNLRSFGGVLAHEFGHFAQGAGMRLTFVIRNINAWFSRVVHDRDQWDLWLERTARTADFPLGAPLYLAMFCIWLTRRVLWALMWIGHLLSCFALRHMERDADAWEARFAGGDQFADTCRQLQLLAAGQTRALELSRETWKERRLSRNLPDLIAQEAADLPEEAVGRIDRESQASQTRLFDTHPADSDRVAFVRGLEAPGVFRLEAPATALFPAWDALAQRATLRFYERTMAMPVAEDYLLPNEQLRASGHIAAFQACERFFLGRLSILRPLFVDADEIAADSRSRDALDEALEAADEQLAAESETVDDAFNRFADADTARLEALRAQALIAAGRRFSARIGRESRVSKERAHEALEAAAAAMRDSRRELAPFDDLARQRFATALALSLGGPDRPQHSGATLRLLTGLSVLRHAIPQTLHLREALAGMSALLDDLRDENEAAFVAELRERAADLGRQRKEIVRLLGDAPYPFDHANGDISMARFINLEPAPEMDPVLRRAMEAEACVERLTNLYLRIMGSLALVAEEAEEARPEAADA